MKTKSGKKERRRKRKSWPKFVKWTLAIAVLGLIVLGISRMSTVAYTDADLTMIDFSLLSSSERQTALEAANRARCTCGCGMTLAQCVVTDKTCPLRDPHIDRIRTMVREADQS
jgi:hypothetical protein